MKARTVLFILAVMLILGFCSQAKAQYIDLSQGGTIVGQAPCRHDDGKVYLCVIVSHKNDKYAVLIDERGEKIIYKLVGGKLELLWARGAI